MVVVGGGPGLGRQKGLETRLRNPIDHLERPLVEALRVVVVRR